MYADKITLDSLFTDKQTLDSLYTDKPTLDSLFADKPKLDSLYNDKITLDSLYADKAILDSLFADKVALNSLFTDKATLDSIYADKVALDSLYTDKLTLDRIYTSIDNIDRVHTSIGNLDTVYASIGNVDTVATGIAAVDVVSTNILDVNTVSQNIDDVVITAGIDTDISTVAGISAAVSSLYADKLVLDSLYADKLTLDSLFADKITLDSLYTDKSALDRIYASIDNIDRVETSIDNLDRVHTSITNVDRVSVSADNLDRVFTSIDNLDTVEASIGNVDITATHIDNVNTIADNMTDVEYFADIYQGPKDAEPTLRNDGSQLFAGDLYFDISPTSEDDYVMKSYNGITWDTSYTGAATFMVKEQNLADVSDVGEASNNISTWMKDYTESITNKTITDPSNHVHARRIDVEVINTSGNTILAGSPVTFTEVNTGDNYEVLPTNQLTMIAHGFAYAEISDGATGTVVTSGKAPMNTESYTEGEILYVNGGQLTNVEPTEGYSQPMAVVLKDSVDGMIQVLASYPKQDADDVRYAIGVSVKTELDSKVVNSDVLTPVPSGAVFTDTTYTASDFNHDSLSGVSSDEHIDWSLTNAKDIHPDNYTETTTVLSISTNILSYIDEVGGQTDIDLSLYLDDTNLSYIVSGELNGTTGIATFTRDDATTFTVDLSALLDDTSVTVNNTLTSTSTTEALSANQGKVLQDSKVDNSRVLTDVPAGAVFINYVTLSTAATVAVNTYIYADTSGGAFTATLPDSPSANQQILILDAKGSFSSLNLTVAQAASAETIMGLAESLVLDVANKQYTLIYTGSDWRVI